MKVKKERNLTLKQYTLHDARVEKIELNKDNIILKLDFITSYPQGKEVFHKANVILDNIDAACCEVYVFDKLVDCHTDNKFSGECLELKKFVEKYNPLEFEIINELDDGYNIILDGWLYINKEPVSCTMNFWTEGSFIYDIYEEIGHRIISK